MHRTRGFLTLLPLHGRGQPGRLVRACDTTQGNGCLIARDEDRTPLEVESRACGPLVHGVPHKTPVQRGAESIGVSEAQGKPQGTMPSPWRLSMHHDASRRTGLPQQTPLQTHRVLHPGFAAYCGNRLTALETVLHWNFSVCFRQARVNLDFQWPKVILSK